MDEKKLREIVEGAGGVYQGIQKTLPGDEDLVLFGNAAGSTKALPISKLTEKNAKAKLAKNL